MAAARLLSSGCSPQAPGSACPPPWCPGEGQLRRGAGKEEPKQRSGRLSANRLLQERKRSQKKVVGKGESSDKKVQTKGRSGAKGQQAEVDNQKTKETHLQKTERLKMRRAQPLMKKRKKPSLIDATHPVLPVVPISHLVQSRGIFINYFVNVSFLVALKTFLKRRESQLIPFFNANAFY